MSYNFKNLDQKTREIMLLEVKRDIAGNKLFTSNRFSASGKSQYPELLKNAINSGNEETLAQELKNNNSFADFETRNLKSGPIMAKVPLDANLTLAGGEFNRFYIRALCLRAIEDEKKLVVYRAKEVKVQRIESQEKIGQSAESNKLLEDLRNNIGVDTALGIPAGPNSGLSVELL